MATHTLTMTSQEVTTVLPEINFKRFDHTDLMNSWDALQDGHFQRVAAMDEIELHVERMEYIFNLWPNLCKPVNMQLTTETGQNLLQRRLWQNRGGNDW